MAVFSGVRCGLGGGDARLHPNRGPHLWSEVRDGADAGRVPAGHPERRRGAADGERGFFFGQGSDPSGLLRTLPGARLHGVRRRPRLAAPVSHPGDSRGHPPRGPLDSASCGPVGGDAGSAGGVRGEFGGPPDAHPGDAGGTRSARREGPGGPGEQRGAGGGLLLSADGLLELGGDGGGRVRRRAPGGIQECVRAAIGHGGRTGGAQPGDLADPLRDARDGAHPDPAW